MKTIYTDKAPEPVGPYAQGIEVNGFIFTAMQLPIDPAQPERKYESVADEARQLINNVLAVTGGPRNIVKATVYMADLDDFAAVNEIYAELFGGHEPARSVVNVAAIPKGYRLAMEAIAVTKN